MNKEEQRIKILECLGWTNLKKINLGALRGTSPEGGKNTIAPNPLTNLNAMHEAINYARANFRDINGDLFWCDGQFSVFANRVINRNHWDDDVPLMLITAPQYAEIFLKTLGLWKN